VPGAAQVVALVVLVVLLAVLGTFAWRLSRWLLQTRQLLSFQVGTSDVAQRAEGMFAAISEQIDAVRRGMRPGEEISADLARAIAAADAFAVEARRLRPPAAGRPILAAIVAELERAGRAIEMVDYGCQLAGGGSRRDQDPEAQTSIKRGDLNLLHARESIAEQAAAAAGLPVPGPRFLAERVIREVRDPRL
jgi:hypothetical protein